MIGLHFDTTPTRPHAVRLSDAMLRELATAARTGVPLGAGACAELRWLAEACVVRPPYHVVLDGLDAVAEADWREAAHRLAIALGDVVEMSEVVEVGICAATGHYRTAGAGLPLPAPRYAMTVCIRPTARGALTLVDARTVLAEIRARSSAASLRLFEPFAVASRGRVLDKPVFYRRGDQLCASYHRAAIAAGYARPGVLPLDDEGRAALDCLDAVLERHDAVAARVALARGQILLCNNTALLHGRAAGNRDGAELSLVVR